jgi:hypothetical protein
LTGVLECTKSGNRRTVENGTDTADDNKFHPVVIKDAKYFNDLWHGFLHVSAWQWIADSLVIRLTALSGKREHPANQGQIDPVFAVCRIVFL